LNNVFNAVGNAGWVAISLDNTDPTKFDVTTSDSPDSFTVYSTQTSAVTAAVSYYDANLTPPPASSFLSTTTIAGDAEVLIASLIVIALLILCWKLSSGWIRGVARV
jgi:hypothetical protein